MENNPTSKYDLLYFSNNNIYKQADKIIENPNNVEDIKFYKKRIIHLTKQLLKKEIDTTTSISESFNNYINQAIMHFKFIDKKDIVQKEYEHIIVKKKPPEKNFKIMEQNEMMMKDKKNTNKTILDFLPIVVKEKARKKIVIPKQKIYDIKNPSLREKGIKK